MSGQAFIFTCYPPPGRPIRTPSGLVVHLHSPSTAVKAFPDRERSSRSSSLAIFVSGPRAVQPFIFTRYPPPGRRTWSPNGPAVHLYSLTATRQAYPDPKWSIFTRHPAPGGRFRAANGPAVYPHSISATRKAYPDREWSRRLSSLAIRRQEGVSAPGVV